MNFNIADIKRYDVANGEGIRMSIFVSGCEHKCEGCFNHVAQDFKYGKPFEEYLNEIMQGFFDEKIEGLSLLGGEPLHPENIVNTFSLVFLAKLFNKNIWVWTGYTYEELKSRDDVFLRDILKSIDVLVDGRFEKDKKDLTLKWKGSSNQRVIDVKKSLNENKVVLWED